MESIKLELQIELLEKKLRTTPESINDRYNKHHFALKNKIKTLKDKLVSVKQHEFLAQ